jgi:hypothetical protein
LIVSINLHAARRSITSRIHKILDDYGLENAVSGGKFDDLRQEISPTAGYWERSSVISKPSRLIVHFLQENDRVVAMMPPDNTNGNFAYANTAKRPVSGLSVRILPVIKLADAEFRPYPEWEWLLWYCFWPKLRHGSSGQLFDGFDPTSGKFTYMGHDQPYIAAGLVTLNEPTNEFVDQEHNRRFTYGEATEALRDLIQVAPTPPAVSAQIAAAVAAGEQEADANA